MGYYIGIILISAATLLLELTLLRLFAVQQFYHFAFMAVSLALLGAGASGSILSVWGRRLSPPSLCLLFGGATIGAYLTINYLPFDSFSIAWDSRQVIYLVIYFLATAVPFLFSGLLIGGELMVARQGVGSHQVYGANLLGSAAGSLASLLILAILGGEGAVMLTAVIGWVAGLLLLWQMPGARDWSRSPLGIILIILILLGLGSLVRLPDFMNQRLSPYKTLSVLSQAFDTRQTVIKWDATTRVDVVESSTIHSMPGLSLSSPIGPPTQAGLMLDGDNLMPINGLLPEMKEAAILTDNLPVGLVYRLRPNGRILVLEAGTGMDVLWALAAGADSVTVVEENRLVLETMQNEYDTFSGGLYHDPRVQVVNQSSRVYVRQPMLPSYEVVILALTDTHRPVTSGAYSLTENYAYTVQAIADYLSVLDEDGVLVISRWLQTPPSESGRLWGTMVAALRQIGRDPASHLVAFRSLRTMTVLAGNQPFSETELNQIHNFSQLRGFDVVYFPGIQTSDVNLHNKLLEPVYYNLFLDILNDPDVIYDTYRYDIRPPTDNRPFFFHYFKWEQTPEILAGFGLSWLPFGGSGFFVLVALLLLVSLAAAIFIMGPLLLKRYKNKQQTPIRGRVFIYFAGLGLGFLFVEIPLAQQFILVLAHPVTALAIVIFTILLFSGFGSLTVRYWRLGYGLALLILLILLYPWLLERVLPLAISWPEWRRISLTVFVIAPLGYLMGLPFAAGLQVVEKEDSRLVPWVWAINGSFSVISAVLAVMIALSWGFTAVLWLGAVSYGVAFLAFRGLLTAPRG